MIRRHQGPVHAMAFVPPVPPVPLRGQTEGRTATFGHERISAHDCVDGWRGRAYTPAYRERGRPPTANQAARGRACRKTEPCILSDGNRSRACPTLRSITILVSGPSSSTRSVAKITSSGARSSRCSPAIPVHNMFSRLRRSKLPRAWSEACPRRPRWSHKLARIESSRSSDRAAWEPSFERAIPD